MIENIYGHRGARGLYPENTLFGFEKCLENNLTGFELDVVVSKDRELIVSHEPWMNHKYCLHPNGLLITENNQKSFNLFQLTVDEIQQFDCGSKFNSDFPHQTLKKCYKPTLEELIQKFKLYNYEDIEIQIELKSFKEWYHIFQPDLNEYADLVIQFIKKHNFNKKDYLIKSFDADLLNKIHQSFSNCKFGFLIDNDLSINENLKRLNFKPDYYNLEQSKITKSIVDELKKNNLNIIPWTVNTLKDAKRLKQMGINSIITDYPNLFKYRFN